MSPIIEIISILLALIIGVVVGYWIFKSVDKAKITGAKSSAEQILRRSKTRRRSIKKRSPVGSEG